MALPEKSPASPYCTGLATASRRRKTALFYCNSCQRHFNERTGTPFNDLHFPTNIVFQVVLWRLRYKLSLRDLSEMFLTRGFELSHETVREWEERFAPLLTKNLRLERKRDWKRTKSKSWHVDETCLKIKGHQYYLYRAIDK